MPLLVARKPLADAADVASVLHSRVDRWANAAEGRRRHTGQLIAGLIPRAQGVSDPDMARALAQRDDAMEQRALTLADEAVAARHNWVRHLGVAGVVVEILITQSPKDVTGLSTVAITAGCLGVVLLTTGIYFIPRMRLRHSGGESDATRDPHEG